MSRRIDNRRDILLLLLYSPGRSECFNEPIIGRTRLVKTLFLFREEVLSKFRKGIEITEDNFYKFFPWNFGPFSSQVYDDLNFFILRGFIEAEESLEETTPESAAEWEEWLRGSEPREDDGISEYEESEFRLSEDRGVLFAKDLYETLSVSQKKLLKTFKVRTTRVPLRALLEYVYENYEDQTTRSIIKDEIIKNKGC